jgi:hypothetical protein
MLHPFPFVYGNEQLLSSSRLAYVESVQRLQGQELTKKDIEEIEEESTELVIDQRKILVTGIHNQAHQKAACIPLRFASPRILVLAFDPRVLWINRDEDELPELFDEARLWRYRFDPLIDLVLCTSLSPILANKAAVRQIPRIDRIAKEISRVRQEIATSRAYEL